METEQVLLGRFLSAHPSDAARLLEQLNLEQAAGILGSAPPRTAAEVLRRLAPLPASACLAAIEVERGCEITAALPVEISLGLLRRMDASKRQSLLDGLPPKVQARLQLLLRYPEGTVGSLMDPLAEVLPDDITIGEGLKHARQASVHLYHYLYVVDRSQQLVGVLDVRELIRAPSDALVRSVMKQEVTSVYAHAGAQSVLVHPAWREYYALPVVDEKGLFVGALRFSVLRQIGELGAPTTTGVDALVALGELYWVGMSRLLGGLSSAAEETTYTKPDSSPGDRP